MAETWSGDIYCVKCKEKRNIDSAEIQTNGSRRMAKATCPQCGTKLTRFLASSKS